MSGDDNEISPLGGSLLIDFGKNESVAEIDLETDQVAEILLVSQCPN